MSIPTPSLPPVPVLSGPQQAPVRPESGDAGLMAAARALETSFLTEMLKQTGLGKPSEDFGGGVGEDQFSGHLAQLRAEQMVEAGGIGLAERIFEDLKARAAQ